MRFHHSTEDVISLFKEKPLEFVPGHGWAYSNSDYVLLTHVIERVSGLPFGEYLEQHICDPAELTNTGFNDGRTVLSDVASGYSVWKDIIPTEHVDLSVAQGAYGMYFTVEDLRL